MDASLLCEVPCQEGNERCQEHNYEEWQASNPGCMPDLWHENVQNWKKLAHLLVNSKGFYKGWIF